MTELGKTPWVDRTMRTMWDRIAKKVPASWMPRWEEGTPKPQLTEYGCGHYGCVMPTNEPGLVCKLTTDISEARFIAIAMPLGDVDGIVQYKKIFALKDAGHKGRPMFVLWRTEAFDVGLLNQVGAGAYGTAWFTQHPALSKFIKDEYDKRTIKEGISLLQQFQREAAVVRKFVNPRLQALSRGNSVPGRERGQFITDRTEFLKTVWDLYEHSNYDKVEYSRHGMTVDIYGAPSHVKGYQRVGVALSNCYACAEEIDSTAIVYSLGKALMHYLDDGLLLADVHLGNIGISDDNELIITDPGHVVEVNPRWAVPVDVDEV